MSEEVAGARKRGELLGAAAILSKGREHRDFLVERKEDKPLELIPEHSYTLLTADPNHGKTWAALELARLLATPEQQRPESRLHQWLGVYDVKPRGVLYLDEENGPWLVGRRLRQLGLPEDGNIRVWCHARLRLDKESDVKEIGKRCRDEGLQVVFIDSLVRFHQQDENDAAKIGMVGSAIRTLVEEEKLTVIALHHNRKAQGPAEVRMRGSNEIMAAADTVLYLKRLKGRFVLSATKMRYSNKDHFRDHWFALTESAHDEFRITYGWERAEIDQDMAKDERLDSKEAVSVTPVLNERTKKVLGRVSQLISDGHAPTITKIRVGAGNNTNVAEALKTLVKDKRLSVMQKGRSTIYSLPNKTQLEEESA